MRGEKESKHTPSNAVSPAFAREFGARARIQEHVSLNIAYRLPHNPALKPTQDGLTREHTTR